MDYTQKVKELEANKLTPWFKPQAGTYKCVILAEPEGKIKTFKRGTDEEENTVVLSVQLETNGTTYTWDIGASETFRSAYGQLMLLGSKHGKLCGLPFTLLVKRSNNKNEYTILEALDLMPKDTKPNV